MLVVCTYENTTNRRGRHGMAFSNRIRSIEAVSKYVWSLYIWKHSTPKVSPRRCSCPTEMSCAQTFPKFVWGLFILKYRSWKGNDVLQTKGHGKNTMIKTYGKWNVCRCAWMEFPDTSMQLQLHENKTGSLTRLSQNCTKPITGHSMTFSRRQNKHLKNPATLETSGSTSTVAWKKLHRSQILSWTLYESDEHCCCCADATKPHSSTVFLNLTPPWHRSNSICGSRFGGRIQEEIHHIAVPSIYSGLAWHQTSQRAWCPAWIYSLLFSVSVSEVKAATRVVGSFCGLWQKKVRPSLRDLYCSRFDERWYVGE